MRDEPWDADPSLPWDRIKTAWDGYWDHSKPVLVEKSPPNLIRVAEIREHFDPAAFVVMVRDPYALTEGLMRRNGWSAGFSAAFAIRTLRAQMDNARSLGDDALVFTYEELVADPIGLADRIGRFLPELADIDPRREFAVHSIDGDGSRAIVDLNVRKVARLTPGHLRTINEILRPNDDVMRFWGYGYVEPAGRIGWTAWRLRTVDRIRDGYRRVRSRTGRVVGRVARRSR